MVTKLKRCSVLQIVLSFLALTQPMTAGVSDIFDPDRIDTQIDIFTYDEAHLVRLALGEYQDPDITSPPPAMLGYVPLVVKNNSGLSSDRLYLVGKGQNLSATDAYFLQPNLTTGICTLVLGTSVNSTDPSISVKLSQLPSAGTNAYYIYSPQLVSGRLYISVDHPLYMETLNGPSPNSYAEINDPSQSTVQDPNYYSLYQDLEFTFDKNYDLYTNVTNVDYFSLPMTLGSYTYPTGQPYPTLDNLTIVGYPIDASRTNVLKNIRNGIKKVSQWQTLPIPFYSNPYAVQNPSTYLRILAAKTCIGLGQNAVQFQGGANPQSFFTSQYLQTTTTGPSSGYSYMSQLYQFYQSSSLEFTIFPSNLPSTTYKMTSSGTANTLTFTPTTTAGNPPTRTLNLTNVSTVALFTGAVGDFTTAFNAGGTDPYNTEISKFLSAMYSIGFLPHPSTITQPVVSESSYFANYRSQYFSNPKNFTENGPWYNLYDQVIHPLLLKTGGYGLGYAYDFDDLLDLAGLIHVNIETDGVLNAAQPYPVLYVGPIDSVIPNPTENFGPYTLKILGGLPASSHPISIIYSTNESQAPNQTSVLVNAVTTTLTNLQNYFQVKFYSIYGSTLTCNVYPQYQLILPTTARYNSTDVALMNGIVFDTGTDGTTFIISVPNTQSY